MLPGMEQQGEGALEQTVLMLFRKDLRLDDNPALRAALQTAKHVIPVFIWSPEEEGQFQPGRCSRWWLKQSLAALSAQLAALGSRLIIRRGQACAEALLQLLRETGAAAVFFNHLFDPISLVRDHDMKQQLTEAGAQCRSYNADLLYEPWAVLDSNGEPFTTFETFWQQLQAMPQQPPLPWPPPAGLPAVEPSLHSASLDSLPFFASREQEQATGQLSSKWCPGCEGGAARLEAFLQQQLQHFSHRKANVDRCCCSRLSPWVRDGSISVRRIYHQVLSKQAEWAAAAAAAGGGGDDHASSCRDFMQQLAYREYSRYLSFHFPFMHERPLLSHLRCVPWNLDQHAFKAWKMGMTGYPLIDAAMKQLWSTGWMHNRLRVVCGVFAVKYLLLPWQWGLKHYWDQLLDADLESDALGWQYVSGCMVDAPPFGQLMDIPAEAASFDPDGEFVRRWLPVLARLPTQHVHAPWTAPQEVLDAADTELGFNYPFPIVTPEDAAARLASAAAVIEASVQQQDQQQQQPQQQQQQQQQQQSLSRQPYRPPTEPLQSHSRAHDAAAAAAAEHMRQQHSNVQLDAPPQQQHSIGAVAAAAATAAGAGAALPPAVEGLPSGVQAAAAAAAAGPEALGQQQQQQQDDVWQQQALQNDVHLRQRQQQHRHQQLQQRLWHQQQRQHRPSSRKRRQQGSQELQQRHRSGGSGLAGGGAAAGRPVRSAAAAAAGAAGGGHGAWEYGCYDDYESSSECSEQNSNAPAPALTMETACSGIMQQRGEGDCDEQQEQEQDGGWVLQQQQWQRQQQQQPPQHEGGSAGQPEQQAEHQRSSMREEVQAEELQQQQQQQREQQPQQHAELPTGEPPRQQQQEWEQEEQEWKQQQQPQQHDELQAEEAQQLQQQEQQQQQQQDWEQQPQQHEELQPEESQQRQQEWEQEQRQQAWMSQLFGQ